MPLFRRDSARPDDERWAIVGLGNPGDRYARNRHNVGALVLSSLTDARFKTHKSGCLVAETSVSGHRVVLARPMTYMNESGRAVRQLLSWYKIPLERLIVIHDELDIRFGEIRIKRGGGTAGHNGLKSVVSHLGSQDFLRVRIGVSRPPGPQDPADYVLNDFSAAQRKDLEDVIARAGTAVETILDQGAERAMNAINERA
ncbi:MAG: aminoacyl-tRNA hydrolase [Actinomycetota bacterium]|nr:aminoacyl-tRNA hydrolase [Actinomycetota bacterium]